MGKAKGKKAAGLLADAWIKFPQIAGITHVVSCQWSYMCWCWPEEGFCLPWCPGEPRKLVAPWWDANRNVFVSLAGIKCWLLVANCFMVKPEMCIDPTEVPSQLQSNLEAVYCLFSKFLNKTLSNSMWWFRWNRISRQGKRNSSVLWFLVLWCPSEKSFVNTWWPPVQRDKEPGKIAPWRFIYSEGSCPQQAHWWLEPVAWFNPSLWFPPPSPCKQMERAAAKHTTPPSLQ